MESDPTSISSDPGLLQNFLGERDVPCPRCEYNLRGLQGNRCPECGDELTLRVNLAEPRLRALIAGLVGLSAGAGLNGLLIVYAIIQLLAGRGGGFERFWVIIPIGLAVLGTALAAWIRSWRRIRRAQQRTQRWLAIAAWVLTLLDLVLFSIYLK